MAYGDSKDLKRRSLSIDKKSKGSGIKNEIKKKSTIS